jgi:energy-coupling factor transporter transmembrane protein EcfT
MRAVRRKEKGILCADIMPLVLTSGNSLAVIVSPAELPFARILLVLGTMLVGLIILRAVAILTLRSSREPQEFGMPELLAKRRDESLRNQDDVPQLPHEEERTLSEELERQENRELRQRAEQLELELQALLKVQQEAEQLDQERQQLIENLGSEREERLEAQQRAERLEQERLHLEHEHQQLKVETDILKRQAAHRRGEQPAARRPRWRKLTLAVILLLAIFVMWFTSSVVALILLQP